MILLSPPSLILLGLSLFSVAFVLGLIAWRREGKLVAMRVAPTLSVAELSHRHRSALYAPDQRGPVAIGAAVEVVGTIECDEPLAAPYSETACVAFRYNVHESQERRVDLSGGRNRRAFAFGGQDAQQQHVARFYVHDSSGRIAIDPSGAEFDMPETIARYEAFTGLTGSQREIWREEHALPVGNRVYILGYLLDDQGQALIGRHPLDRSQRFVISHRDEASLSAHVRTQSYALYACALLLVAGATVAWLAAALH